MLNAAIADQKATIEASVQDWRTFDFCSISLDGTGVELASRTAGKSSPFQLFTT
jgi:hypothetical protein